MPHITVLLALVLLLIIAHRSSESKFNVFDYFIGTDGKASWSKTAQVIAGVTATIVVIKASAHNTLNESIFAIYLGALGVSEGWSKYVGAKFSTTSKDSKD